MPLHSLDDCHVCQVRGDRKYVVSLCYLGTVRTVLIPRYIFPSNPDLSWQPFGILRFSLLSTKKYTQRCQQKSLCLPVQTITVLMYQPAKHWGFFKHKWIEKLGLLIHYPMFKEEHSWKAGLTISPSGTFRRSIQTVHLFTVTHNLLVSRC